MKIIVDLGITLPLTLEFEERARFEVFRNAKRAQQDLRDVSKARSELRQLGVIEVS